MSKPYAYYNEHDAYAAQWLRNLIAEGLIAPGEVDERDIQEVRPDDLQGFIQVHAFSGISGWSRALRLAGWPDDRPVWTGSAPCQPFSVAGKGAAENDHRHLWPDFFRLIAACRPPVVMGEQVAGAAGYRWFDGVAADLEREDYACRAVDIPACAVNAPHIRQRLYWIAVGDSSIAGTGRNSRAIPGTEATSASEGRDTRRISYCAYVSSASDMANSDDAEWRAEKSGRHVIDGPASGRDESDRDARKCCFWRDADRTTGADGKTRRVKPGVRLLAHGVPARVGRLRAYGNAVVPPLAAEVIRALMECLP